MHLDQKIEAILFYKGEPMKIKKLAEFLGVSENEIVESLTSLDQKLSDRGLQIIYKENEVMLGTRADLSPILEKLRKEELGKELSKASLETLSIILYKQGATRGDIDYIRGVNSSFILRNLLVRGLIEKIVHPRDSRKFFYKATFNLLCYLGISRMEELPEFNEMEKILGQRVEEGKEAEVISD